MSNENAVKAAEDLLKRARSTSDNVEERLTTLDSYAEVERGRTIRYMTEGGGPTVFFYVVYDSVGEMEFGVVEYLGSGDPEYVVLRTIDAEIVELALRTKPEDS